MLVALALAFTVLRPPPTPGPFGRDFEAYYAAGATWNAGGDPYSRMIWQVERTIDGVDTTHEEMLPFVGPPASLPLWSLFARLPHPIALRVWSTLLSAAFLTLIASALRLARAPRDPLLYLSCAGFAFASGPIISDIALGQVALLSAAMLALAQVAYRARSRIGAIGTTLVAAIQPNLALVLVARMRSRFDIACASSAACAFLAIGFGAATGFGGWSAYLARLRAHGSAERFITIQHTPSAIAYAFGLSEAAATAIGLGIALAAIAFTVFAIVRLRLGATAATLLSIALLPLAIPFFHEHDFVITLVPAIVLAMCARGRIQLLAGVGTALVMVDWFGFAQRENAHAQIITLALAMALGFAGIALANDDKRRFAFSSVLTILIAAAIIVPIARAHVAPTWPDTLPPGYRGAVGADASAVWGDEQHAAGLDRREPTWAALRLFPLIGCLVLAGSILGAGKRRELPAD